MTADPRYDAEVERRLRVLPGGGDLPRDAPGVITGRSAAADQGAQVLLAFRVDAGTVAEARFRAYGCPHFIAAASWLTERLVGATRRELEGWDWREAARALEVPPAKFGRLLTLQDAVRAAAATWPEPAAAGV